MQVFPRWHIQRQRKQIAGPAHIKCVFGEPADIALDDHHVLRGVGRSLGVLGAVAHPDLMDPNMRFFWHVPNLARQQQIHARGFAPGQRRYAGGFARSGVCLDVGADRRTKADRSPTPTERDGVIDRPTIGIEHDGPASEIAVAGEFVELFRSVAGDDSDRADPAAAIRFACDLGKVHRTFMFFEHGAGVSRSTNRGHQTWQRYAKGDGTKQRRATASKAEFAEATVQCLVAVCASGPNSARRVQTLAIRRTYDRKAGLTLLLANCVKSDARRMHSKSCCREYSVSDIVHPWTIDAQSLHAID